MKIQVEYSVKSVVKSLPDNTDVDLLRGNLQNGAVDFSDLPATLDENSKVPMSVNLMEDDGSFIDTVIL